MRTVSIYPERGGGFVADDLGQAGSPAVGRGRTQIEALRAFLAQNGFNVVVLDANPREIVVKT